MKIEYVYLKFGNACNACCKHCTQKTFVNNNFSIENIDKSVIDFLRNNEIDILLFWGGEPLVYWESIKKVFEYLEKECVNVGIYSIITNGLALNKDIMDYLELHSDRISLGLSYDFPNSTALRDRIPSEKQLELFKGYSGNKFIVSVLSNVNNDVYSLVKEREKIFPDKKIVKKIELFLSNDEYNSNLIKQIDLNKLKSSMYKHAYTGNYNVFSRYSRKKDFSKEDLLNGKFLACGSGYKRFTIDFQGNFYYCSNSEKYMGNLNKDRFDKILQNYIDESKKLLSPACEKCEVLDYCGSYCRIGLQENNEYVECSFLKAFYTTALKCNSIMKSRGR